MVFREEGIRTELVNGELIAAIATIYEVEESLVEVEIPCRGEDVRV